MNSNDILDPISYKESVHIPTKLVRLNLREIDLPVL